MEPNQLSNYLISRGYEVKSQAGEDVFRPCPFCRDDRWKFYVSPDKNVYYCQKCNAKGNLKTLKEKLGDTDNTVIPITRVFKPKQVKVPPPGEDEQRHQALYRHPEAIKYLKERGLREETIKHFKLGYYLDKDNVGWINIPYYEDGKLVCSKRRSLPPAKTFKRSVDAKSTLYNQDCLPEFDEVIITEGEFDAMMCWQAGHANVVSVPNGVTKEFAPEWMEQLAHIGRVYLWYDNDGPGIEASDELVNQLGLDRSFLFRFKGFKDANDYFLAQTDLDFKAAKQKKVKNVVTLQESISKIFERKQQPELAIGTPWQPVNRLLYGIEPGDLITLSATPKIGKTTFALNIAIHNAKRGFPVFFYCLEMRPERIAMKVVSHEAEMNDQVIDQEIADRIGRKLAGLPLYLGHNYKDIDADKVFETIAAAVRRYSIKLVVFDHLHFLVRSLAHITAEIGILSRRFKLLAEELHIPIILIAQPRKVEDDKVMTMNDLKDSSSIGADSDQVIILWRKKTKAKPGVETQSSYEPKTLVRVDASRFTPGGDTMLYYKGEHSRFKEIQNEEDSVFGR